MRARFSAAIVSLSPCWPLLPFVPIAGPERAAAATSSLARSRERTRSRISLRMLSTSVSAIANTLSIGSGLDTLMLPSINTEHTIAQCYAGIKVGNPFSQAHARDSYEERCIEPVISLPVTTVDCQRDRILIDAEPTIESKSNLDHLTTAHGPKFHLLFFRVRAVGMDAVGVADQKTNYRIVHVMMKARQHAQRQWLATLDDFHASARGIGQLRSNNLGTSVAMAVSVANRRQAFIRSGWF